MPFTHSPRIPRPASRGPALTEVRKRSKQQGTRMPPAAKKARTEEMDTTPELEALVLALHEIGAVKVRRSASSPVKGTA